MCSSWERGFQFYLEPLFKEDPSLVPGKDTVAVWVQGACTVMCLRGLAVDSHRQ